MTRVPTTAGAAAKALLLSAAVLLLAGLVLLALPGPGLLVLGLAVPLFLAGIIAAAIARTARR